MKKTLLFILLTLTILHTSYAQEEESAVGTGVFVEVEEENGVDVVVSPGAEEAVADDWVEAPLDDYLAEDFNQQVIDFCRQWAFNWMIGYEFISNTSTYTDQVNSVEFSRKLNRWRISMTFNNDEDRSSFDSEFVVRANNFISPTIVIEESSFSQASSIEGDAEDEEEVEVEARLLQDEEELDVEEEPEAGGWEKLDVEQAQDDPAIKALIDQGVAAAIEKGVTDGTIPEGDWRLWFVETIERQVVEGTKYAFGVALAGSAEAKALIFVVEPLEDPSWVLSSGFWSLTPLSA